MYETCASLPCNARIGAVSVRAVSVVRFLNKQKLHIDRFSFYEKVLLVWSDLQSVEIVAVDVSTTDETWVPILSSVPQLAVRCVEDGGRCL